VLVHRRGGDEADAVEQPSCGGTATGFLRGRKRPRVSAAFFISYPLLSEYKSSYKTGQNSLRLLWWKPCGMRDNTFVPYEKSLTSFPHLGRSRAQLLQIVVRRHS